MVGVENDTYRDLINKRKDLTEALNKEISQIVEDTPTDDTRKQIEDIFNKSSNISKWDDSIEESRIEHLKGQLNDFINLRESLEDGNKWASLLDETIIKLSKHVEELDDAFRLKNAQKEIDELKKQRDWGTYSEIMNTSNAIVSLGNSIDSLANLEEVEKGWKRFAAGLTSSLSIIDTIVNSVKSISNIIELFSTLAKKEEALSIIQAGTTAAKIAGIEGEAAAVVAAEGVKTTAKETAAVTDIATKAV
jgi:hypothetical protein